MIAEKATELGRLIGQSDEYKALRRAEGNLRDDKDTVEKLDAIQKLATTIEQAMAQGELPEPEATKAYEEAVRQLEVSPVGQAYVVARANFDKLMARVNQQIGEGIERGATSGIITLG